MVGGFGPIRQLAFVVGDVVAAATQWAELYGAGPFTVYEVDITDTEYRGTPARMWARMALGQLGDQQIELIEPLDDSPSVYREFLDAGGTGVHHVCFWHDIDDAVDRLGADGSELVQRGVTSTGAGFAYVSGAGRLPYVEIVDPTAGDGAMAMFFAAVAAAADGWDGSDPVRIRSR